jgi:hypothetical protein
MPLDRFHHVDSIGVLVYDPGGGQAPALREIAERPGVTSIRRGGHVGAPQVLSS